MLLYHHSDVLFGLHELQLFEFFQYPGVLYEIQERRSRTYSSVRPDSGIVFNSVAPVLDVLDRSRIVQVRPHRGVFERFQVVAIELVVVVEGVSVLGNRYLSGREELHPHPLEHHFSGVNQTGSVVVDVSDDHLDSLLVAARDDVVEVLPVLLSDHHRLSEERHFGDEPVEADPVSERRPGVECRGFQRDRETFRSLEPGQLQSELFLPREECRAEVGGSVRSSLYPVGSDLFSCYVVEYSRHCQSPLTRRRTRFYPRGQQPRRRMDLRRVWIYL